MSDEPATPEQAAETTADAWTSLVSRVLAPNANAMTLDGTNSYVIRHPDSHRVIVVDPGPDDDAHLRDLAAHGEVALILLTHHHGDHSEGAPALAELTGAPVRAVQADLCIGADPLRDGECIAEAGVAVDVIATPGHTLDSVCFVVRDAESPLAESPQFGANHHSSGVQTQVIRQKSGDSAVILTGDTILGRGTTVLAGGDTALTDYLETLDALAEFGPIAALPGHGPIREDLAAACAQLAAHRHRRLADVTAALRELGREASVDQETVELIADHVYGGVPNAPRFATIESARAQLHYLVAAADR